MRVQSSSSSFQTCNSEPRASALSLPIRCTTNRAAPPSQAERCAQRVCTSSHLPRPPLTVASLLARSLDPTPRTQTLKARFPHVRKFQKNHLFSLCYIGVAIGAFRVGRNCVDSSFVTKTVHNTHNVRTPAADGGGSGRCPGVWRTVPLILFGCAVPPQSAEAPLLTGNGSRGHVVRTSSLTCVCVLCRALRPKILAPSRPLRALSMAPCATMLGAAAPLAASRS